MPECSGLSALPTRHNMGLLKYNMNNLNKNNKKRNLDNIHEKST